MGQQKTSGDGFISDALLSQMRVARLEAGRNEEAAPCASTPGCSVIDALEHR